jgi:sulfate-transporting ATPase
LVLVFFALAAAVVANLRRSQLGRRLIAVRANERAAESLGIGSRQTKVYAFLVGSALAALGGTLLAFHSTSILLSSYDTLGSVNLVVLTVIGGAGWIAGAVIGGISQGGSLGAQVMDLLGSGWDAYIPIISGVLLLFIVTKAPDGIAPFKYKMVRWVESRRAERKAMRASRDAVAGTGAEQGQQDGTQEGAPTVAAASLPEPRTLEVHNLTVRFGGVTAVDDVTLRVNPGELVGLIGPNGAGKTTLIDAVTGFVHFDGAIVLNGEDISRWSVKRRAAAGLGRSFQSLELFEDVTVLENLRCASEAFAKPAYLKSLIKPASPPLTAGTVASIKEFQLEDSLESLPTNLPYGKRRLVAIARTVAMQPGILLLDEPASGLDERESDELGRLIRRLTSEWGIGVLLVEHNVDVVMSYCDRIYVLEYGRLIAEGSPQEIRHDEGVIRAYLGEASQEAPVAEETVDHANGPVSVPEGAVNQRI